MNILPHKSWHVRRKDNIERVRRDEAKAAEEEKERQGRIALAEQEARTELLRSKNKKRIEGSESHDALESTRCKDEQGTSLDIYSGTGGHINFFKDAEEGISEKNKNKEHEEEKLKEKEKWEKSMGILTYLGQSATEDPAPWYMSKKRKKDEGIDSARGERDEKRKDHMDPIHELNRYVEKTKESHNPDKHKHKHKDKKKHKHKSRKNDKEKSYSLKSSSSTKTMDQLRAERLKRETDEKKRTSELMAKLRGETVPNETDSVEMSDRQRGYNSQYNPDFVRRPKDR